MVSTFIFVLFCILKISQSKLYCFSNETYFEVIVDPHAFTRNNRDPVLTFIQFALVGNILQTYGMISHQTTGKSEDTKYFHHMMLHVALVYSHAFPSYLTGP